MVPSTLLRSLERFFGEGLSRVRLRTGSPLPALVGAEAFAWNDQICLTDPAPDFSSRRSIGLLVHEMAHICQQRAAPVRPAFPVRVGAADDRLETEADGCARAFLSGRPRPALTADTEPALRRVLSIVPGTAKLTFDFKKAKPALTPTVVKGEPVVVCHLTNGFTSVDIISDAISWTGEVAVRSAVSDPAELKTLRIGFIQFQRIDAMNMSYVGRLPSDGEVNINPFGLVNPRHALDSEAGISPFTSAIELPVQRGIAPAVSGDHPALKAGGRVTNRANQAFNFLFKITDRRRFFTTLVAQNRATKSIQYLANHSWELFYQFQLIWQNGIPSVFSSQSTILPMDPVTPGPPTDPGLAGLLAAPRDPFGNDVGRAAQRAAVLGGLPTREDLSARQSSTIVPPNFFT